jgi:DNA-damage-inducible protein J
MKTEQVSVRIDSKTKAGAEAVFRKLGLSPTDAVRMFYSQVKLGRGLPFEARIPNAATRKALRDLREGKFMTSKDTESFYKDLGISRSRSHV